MMRIIGNRLLKLAPVLFLVSLATFFLVELVPGDPAIRLLGNDATPEDVARIRMELGLDRPVLERYTEWLGNALQGDFGNSLLKPAFSVRELLVQSLPITLQLATMGILIALIVAIPTALWAAYREGSGFDRASNALTSALISIPSFVAALLLAFLFVSNPTVPRTAIGILGVAAGLWALWTARPGAAPGGRFRVRWLLIGVGILALTALVTNKFPAFNRTGFSRITAEEGLSENLRTAFLPALTIALTEIAVFTRLLRSDLIATLQEDYILSARAKGMSPGKVLRKEALRPSSFSLVTLLGVSLGRAIGGTVIVETVFGIQGVGRLVVSDGVTPGDFPIVQGGVLLIAVFYVFINLLVDLSYLYLDPRVRDAR
ncbi:MAG: ABC transporter permease [Acidimicrobiales bacterium]